jgi:hypothetical protein
MRKPRYVRGACDESLAMPGMQWATLMVAHMHLHSDVVDGKCLERCCLGHRCHDAAPR